MYREKYDKLKKSAASFKPLNESMISKPVHEHAH
jgi:hypothetical protein